MHGRAKVLFTTLLLFSSYSAGELVSVDDGELGDVSGEGIGLALENFIYETRRSIGGAQGASVTVDGIKNTDGTDVGIEITDFYVMGPDSEYGTKGVDSSDPKTYRLGDLSNAIVLDVYDSSDFSSIPNGRSVLSLDFPVFENGSRRDLIYGNNQVSPAIVGLQQRQEELNTITQTLSVLETDFYAQSQGLTELENEPNLVNNIQQQINALNVELWGSSSIPGNPHQAGNGSLYDEAEEWVKDNPPPGQSYSFLFGLTNGEWNDAVNGNCGFDLFADCPKAIGSFASSSYYPIIQQKERERDRLVARRNFLQGISQASVDAAEQAVADERGNIAGQRTPVDSAIAELQAQLSGSNRGADTGISFTYDVIEPDGSARTDFHNYHVTGLSLEDSYLRVWGDGTGSMDGELGLQLYANTLELSSCQWSQPGCGDNQDLDGNNIGDRDQQTFFFTNLYVNLNLGYGLSQPMKLKADDDGNIQLELTPFLPFVGESLQDVAGVPGSSNQAAYNEIKATADDFYANAPKSDLYIGNLTYGGVRPDAVSAPVGGMNLGSSELTGIRIQYLRANTYDLN